MAVLNFDVQTYIQKKIEERTKPLMVTTKRYMESVSTLKNRMDILNLECKEKFEMDNTRFT